MAASFSLDGLRVEKRNTAAHGCWVWSYAKAAVGAPGPTHMQHSSMPRNELKPRTKSSQPLLLFA
jgi:hypothetical protein